MLRLIRQVLTGLGNHQPGPAIGLSFAWMAAPRPLMSLLFPHLGRGPMIGPPAWQPALAIDAGDANPLVPAVRFQAPCPALRVWRICELPDPLGHAGSDGVPFKAKCAGAVGIGGCRARMPGHGRLPSMAIRRTVPTKEHARRVRDLASGEGRIQKTPLKDVPDRVSQLDGSVLARDKSRIAPAISTPHRWP